METDLAWQTFFSFMHHMLPKRMSVDVLWFTLTCQACSCIEKLQPQTSLFLREACALSLTLSHCLCPVVTRSEWVGSSEYHWTCTPLRRGQKTLTFPDFSSWEPVFLMHWAEYLLNAPWVLGSRDGQLTAAVRWKDRKSVHYSQMPCAHTETAANPDHRCGCQGRLGAGRDGSAFGAAVQSRW